MGLSGCTTCMNRWLSGCAEQVVEKTRQHIGSWAALCTWISLRALVTLTGEAALDCSSALLGGLQRTMTCTQGATSLQSAADVCHLLSVSL